MAHYKIEENRKGLVAKIQVFTKDKSGKYKIISKRVYNENNLSSAKFEKYIEKISIQFEDEVLKAYKDKLTENRLKVLTFEQLGQEFVDNIKKNLSISYYDIAKDVVKRFNSYLIEIGLNKAPINEISVREVQMFLNSFVSYQQNGSGTVKLKKDLPKEYSWRLLAR